jgi:hypothetical protein
MSRYINFIIADGGITKDSGHLLANEAKTVRPSLNPFNSTHGDYTMRQKCWPRGICRWAGQRA